MKHYEIVLIIHPDMSEQVSEMLKKYKEQVEIGKGIVHRLEDSGRRHLEYSIKDCHKGHYVVLNIECSKEVLEGLQNGFKYNDSILRNLILEKSEKITSDSALKKKAEEK